MTDRQLPLQGLRGRAVDKVNAMNNYKDNNQGQPRMEYRRGQRKDVCCYNCNKCRHYSRDCLVPKRTRKGQISWVFEEWCKRIFCEILKENNLKPEDFAVEETKEERSISSSINVVHSENLNQEKII